MLLRTLSKVTVDKLSAAERKRNEVGNNYLLRYDKSVSEKYSSSLSVLSDLERSSTKSLAVPFSLAPEAKFIPAVPHGLVYPSPGFPSLNYVPITGTLEKCGVNIFGRSSGKDSLQLCLDSELATGLRLKSQKGFEPTADPEEVFSVAKVFFRCFIVYSLGSC